MVRQYLARGDDRYPPSNAEARDEHAANLIAIAVNAGNERIAALLDALSQSIYPTVMPDMYFIPRASTADYSMAFPGIGRLKKLELFAPNGTMPSLIAVTIDRFSHIPFPLTSDVPNRGPYAFQVIGGATMHFVNSDAANDGVVYVEWELVEYRKKE